MPWVGEASRAAGCDLARLKDGSPLLQAPLLFRENGQASQSAMPSLLCGFLRALKAAVRCLFPGLQATRQRRLSCLGLLNTELMKIAALCLGITWERAKLVATCSRDLQSGPLRKMIEVVVQIREGRLGLSSDGRSRASGEPGRRCRLSCRVPAGIPPFRGALAAV